MSRRVASNFTCPDEIRFPLGLEKWKGTGTVREFWINGKSQGKSHKILENWGNFRQMLFVIFQWQLKEFVYYLLHLIKFSVQKTITEKNTGKGREFFQSGKVGTMWNKGIGFVAFLYGRRCNIWRIVQHPLFALNWRRQIFIWQIGFQGTGMFP